MSSHTFTYGTRIAPDPVLVAAAELCGKVERRLCAHMMRGGALDQDVKDRVMADTGLPGRYYNGITTSLEGKIKAVAELRKLEMTKIEERLKQLGKKTDRLGEEFAQLRAERPEDQGKHDKWRKRLWKLRQAIHGKKRKLHALAKRLEWLKKDSERPVPSLCFGSKKLFRKQFHLAENGYADHAEWKADWQASRSSQFMVPGSHDEVSGNKTACATVEADGSVTLRLVIPRTLRMDPEQKHLILHGLRFGYGHAEVVAAIRGAEPARQSILAYQAETAKLVEALPDEHPEADAAELAAMEKALRKERNAAAKAERAGHTTALTWRFVHDDTGWSVFVSLNHRPEQADWGFAHGAVGLDLNVGFISFMPVDRAGNPLKNLSRDFPFEVNALSSDRARAVMGEAVKAIVGLALEQRRPIVIEDLDFQKKFAALKETVGANLARRLSSFSYSLFKAMLKSRAARFGVRVVEVNPAFTSHMGRAKYARPLGISVHRAAAAMIARRGMGLSEGLSASAGLPLGDGRHVAIPPPERMGRLHVWRSWGRHFGWYKAKRKALDAAAGKGGSARTRAPATVPVRARCQKSGLHPPAHPGPGRPGPQPPLLLGGRPASKREKRDQLWSCLLSGG